MAGTGKVIALIQALQGAGVSPEQIKAAVEEWLAENVDPETGYVLDKTLSIEGAAADAKAAGDEVNELKSAIGNIDGAVDSALFDISANIADVTDLADGYIKDDGTIGSANNYVYTQNYIEIKPGATYAFSGYNTMSIAKYSSDKTFLSRSIVSSTMTFASNVQYIRISGNGTPANWRMCKGTSTVDEAYHAPYLGEDVLMPHQIDTTFTAQGKAAEAKATGDAIDTLNKEDSKAQESLAVLVEYSQNIADTEHIVDGYIAADGSIGTGSGYKYTPNYIRVKPSTTYSTAGLGSVATYTYNKTFISRKTSSLSTITFDANVYYVRLSSNSDPANWRMNEGSTLYDHPYHNPYLGKDVQIIYQANDVLSSKWAGKTYAALGDSITAGYIPRNYEGHPGYAPSYAKLTAQTLGMNYLGYGIAGSSLAYIADRDPMCRRYTDMSDSADVITFMGGANDIRNGIQLGTMADRTDDTYYGALHVLLGGLYKKYMIDQGVTVGKTKKIVALTPIKLLQQSSASESSGEGTLVDLAPWVAAVKEVAAYYGIPVFDFYNLAFINPHLNRTVHGTDDGYTGYYNPYITDGTHPTPEGHKIMADALTGFFRTLM